LGPKVDTDARGRINALAASRAIEDGGLILSHECFGPRIQKEPFPSRFYLPRETPKYNGTAKPEDWLMDYLIAVDIAGGNKRIAVRYVPLMLLGTARTWLNSLPPDSVNSWLDFEEVFVGNFNSTYKRPGRPRHLQLYTQKEKESDRDYLTRWSEMRNSCEGIDEREAIRYFTDGCRGDTMLKHKLLRAQPDNMAYLLDIAEKYATADSALKAPVRLADPARSAPGEAKKKDPPRDHDEAGSSRRYADGRRDDRYKRKGLYSENRRDSQYVALGEEGRARLDGDRIRESRPWQKNRYTLDSMLDMPCKYHSLDRSPANHTTRQCSWTARIAPRRGPARSPSPRAS